MVIHVLAITSLMLFSTAVYSESSELKLKNWIEKYKFTLPTDSTRRNICRDFSIKHNLEIANECKETEAVSSTISGTRANLESTIATMINLNGYLCGKVTNVRPLQLKDTYEVRCIEYGGGTVTVDYIFAIRSSGVIVEKR